MATTFLARQINNQIDDHMLDIFSHIATTITMLKKKYNPSDPFNHMNIDVRNSFNMYNIYFFFFSLPCTLPVQQFSICCSFEFYFFLSIFVCSLFACLLFAFSLVKVINILMRIHA